MNEDKVIRVIFTGFSIEMTGRLIENMTQKLKRSVSYTVFLADSHSAEDRKTCHVYFGMNLDNVSKERYFLSGTADMIYASSERYAVRNISWLKTEGTVIIADKNRIKTCAGEDGLKLREFLKKQEECGFVHTIIH